MQSVNSFFIAFHLMRTNEASTFINAGKSQETKLVSSKVRKGVNLRMDEDHIKNTNKMKLLKIQKKNSF